jgi:hypothetical protein
MRGRDKSWVNDVGRMMCLGVAQGPLQELTPDISKLVNLTDLTIRNATADIEYIPDAISCLTKLEHFSIELWPMRFDVPPALTTLTDLMSLTIVGGGSFKFPDLQVSYAR